MLRRNASNLSAHSHLRLQLPVQFPELLSVLHHQSGDLGLGVSVARQQVPRRPSEQLLVRQARPQLGRVAGGPRVAAGSLRGIPGRPGGLGLAAGGTLWLRAAVTVPGVGRSVTLLGRSVTLVGRSVTLLGRGVTLVGGCVTWVWRTVSLLWGPMALIKRRVTLL